MNTNKRTNKVIRKNNESLSRATALQTEDWSIVGSEYRSNTTDLDY